MKTGLDHGSWTVDVPFKTGLVVWLVKFISSAFSALVAKYSDNDCVDEEDEARSSSGVLILALRCEISAALEPDLKQNLSPAGFTLDPHKSNMSRDTNLRHLGCGKLLMVTDCQHK